MDVCAVVFRLKNEWFPVELTGTKSGIGYQDCTLRALSGPENSMELALEKVRAFAKERKIHYEERCLKAEQPITTVFQIGNGYWYPGTVDEEGFNVLIDGFVGMKLEDAERVALLMANQKGSFFSRQIGEKASLEHSEKFADIQGEIADVANEDDDSLDRASPL